MREKSEMNLREAAEQALEALEAHADFGIKSDKAIIAIRAALADIRSGGINQTSKPVAWMCADESLVQKGYSRFSRTCAGDWNIQLYTAPPKRKPLTGERLKQIELGLRIYYDYDKYDLSLHDFARALERAHGIGGEE